MSQEVRNKVRKRCRRTLKRPSPQQVLFDHKIEKGVEKNPRELLWGEWVIEAPFLGFFHRGKITNFTHFPLLRI